MLRCIADQTHNPKVRRQEKIRENVPRPVGSATQPTVAVRVLLEAIAVGTQTERMRTVRATGMMTLWTFPSICSYRKVARRPWGGGKALLWTGYRRSHLRIELAPGTGRHAGRLCDWGSVLCRQHPIDPVLDVWPRGTGFCDSPLTPALSGRGTSCSASLSKSV